MEKFKSQEEAQKAFEKEGFEYPKYKSGAKKGKIKGSLDSLTKMFLDAMKEKAPKVEEEVQVETKAEEVTVEVETLIEESKEEKADTVEETVVVEEKEVPSKPIFHREKPKRFNPMSFKKY